MKILSKREKIQKKYKFLKYTSINLGLMALGFECGDGWLDLLNDTFKKIDKIVKKKKLKDFRVIQVKEKFGGLRVYTTAAPDEIYNIIDEAGKKSYKICESCGEEGSLKNCKGWWRTLCLECEKGLLRRL